MLKQIVNRNGNWKVDYAIKRTLHIQILNILLKMKRPNRYVVV